VIAPLQRLLVFTRDLAHGLGLRAVPATETLDRPLSALYQGRLYREAPGNVAALCGPRSSPSSSVAWIADPSANNSTPGLGGCVPVDGAEGYHALAFKKARVGFARSSGRDGHSHRRDSGWPRRPRHQLRLGRRSHDEVSRFCLRGSGTCGRGAPDGKIVAVGSTLNRAFPGGGFALARYNPDGSLDPGFGGGGLVSTSFAGSFASGEALALQPDGKIVVAGFVSTTDQTSTVLALARYKADGSLDERFGVDGTVTTDLGTSGNEAHGVAIQPDGLIVVVGTAGLHTAVVRYTSRGTLKPDA
jgi:uncharacterized delta-60 repeat protein